MKKIIILSLPFALSNLGLADYEHSPYKEGQEKFITHQQAAQRAKNAVGGGKIEEVEFKNKQGTPVYEVEIEKKDKDFEVIIDARNGKILRIKRD